MSVKSKKNRIKEVNLMLIKLATGNFGYRLKRSFKNDSIEALVLVTNILAEEIQESFIHQGFVNAKGSIKYIIQMSFLLDNHGIIQMANQKTYTLLSAIYTDIIKDEYPKKELNNLRHI